MHLPSPTVLLSAIATILLFALSPSTTASPTSWTCVHSENECTARHEAALVSMNDRLYLLGGRGMKNVEEFDPVTNTWRKLAKPPMQMHHFQAVVIGDKIAVICAFTGGYPHETPIPDIWLFDPVNDQWTKGPEIPENRRRGSAGVVVVGDLVYIVGGIQDGHWNGFIPWLDTWNTKTGEWKTLPDAPRPRDHFQVALLDGKIIAVGGRTSYGEKKQVFNLTIPEVDAYNIESGTWETLKEPLPTQRAGCMAAVHDRTLLIAGGESVKQPDAHSEVEAFTFASGKWTPFPSLLQGRHGTGLTFIGDDLYIAAGSSKRGGGGKDGVSPEINTIEIIHFHEP